MMLAVSNKKKDKEKQPLLNTMAGVFNIFRLAGDTTHLLSIFILLHKMYTTRSCSGISLKSQLLYALVYVTRYIDLFAVPKRRFITIYNTIMKIFFILSQSLIIYLMKKSFRSTYNKNTDVFRIEFLIVPSVVLGWIFVDRSIFDGLLSFIQDYAWTFSVILESVAIFPQLFQLQKTGEAETITAHYLFCLGLYRVFYVLNWIYRALFGESPELILVLSGCLQSAIYADFFYEYYKKVICYKIFKLPK